MWPNSSLRGGRSRQRQWSAVGAACDADSGLLGLTRSRNRGRNCPHRKGERGKKEENIDTRQQRRRRRRSGIRTATKKTNPRRRQRCPRARRRFTPDGATRNSYLADSLIRDHINLPLSSSRRGGRGERGNPWRGGGRGRRLREYRKDGRAGGGAGN